MRVGGLGGIKDDFDKLVQSTADIRMKIFDGTQHDPEKTANRLWSLVNRYSQDQQRNALYLFASWVWKKPQGDEWRFRYFINNPHTNSLEEVCRPQ